MRPAAPSPMRVLGIDPGSRVTGFGVVELVGDLDRFGRPAHAGTAPAAGWLRHVAHGTLRPPERAELAERLAFLHGAVADVIRHHGPHQVVVEQVFVRHNARSALVLGQARGAVLAAAAGAGLAVHELTPGEVKRAVVGSGGAGKQQVQAMVTRLLGLDRAPARDAADALAAAICRAHATGSLGDGLRWRSGRTRARAGAGRFVIRRST